MHATNPQSANAAVLDILASLLDAERSSIFRFMGPGSPYLGRAGRDVKNLLAEIDAADQRRIRVLYELIDRFGGDIPRHRPGGEEQYLAYLSLEFLLPKLIMSKELTLERYRNAKAQWRQPPAEAAAVIDQIIQQHEQELQRLRAVQTPR